MHIYIYDVMHLKQKRSKSVNISSDPKAPISFKDLFGYNLPSEDLKEAKESLLQVDTSIESSKQSTKELPSTLHSIVASVIRENKMVCCHIY